jgi:simple sugar transport system ATP-binding protein
MTARPVVEAIGLGKRFGPTVALDDAGISVAPGETHALVGRNGAGKSTLVAILTGLQAPDRGTVLFAGEPAPRLSDRDGWRRRVACVYQRSTVIPELTVAENLFLNRYQRGPARLISWPRLRREAARLLADWSVRVCRHGTWGSRTGSSWRSPGRCRSAPGSSSSTSRPPSSTRPRSTGCSTGCATCGSRA